ncbi:3-phosphoshikimate 1-carboxyvinyltransferase [Thiospirochaeta perfilievii]|uniref:3-phosphoshikimate 1-carboxyvinyltransferase n=1 Tax=Thiospirochaeta perfilievii TaxID=252967 RepID=A0A5C1QC51_9SPIO|nr:3-phosphoshikimate 1-carboxyvinyltransferase [Thiospirochaeta perfilievii]QEN05121.1 3-phosphoshikimate 1-carboxyvinyltransferase [Thiospirochaeta perfilievii]
MKIEVSKGKLEGNIRIPASKSHTIRALLIATLAEGESVISYPLNSADTRACKDACIAMGAKIKETDSQWIVQGTGGKLTQPKEAIDVGNSGTTLYLAAAVAALSHLPITFTGDYQIQRRSAANLLNSLEDLGVKVESNNGCAPFTITGPIKGGTTTIECPTSQYLSALLLAAPLSEGKTEINVPLLHEKPYAEMTVRWMEEQGIKIDDTDYSHFVIDGGKKYKNFNRSIPADFSSSAFFFTAAAVTGSTLTLQGLDMSDSQGDKAIVEYLRKMGCEINIDGDNMTIVGKGMTGCDLDINATPDALPALSACACYAQGTTRLLNVPQARMKETDRIAVMTAELRKMGANIVELEDGMEITGGPLKGAEVCGHDDHRVVMALAVAALGAEGINKIDTAEAVDITFPGFFEHLDRLKK